MDGVGMQELLTKVRLETDDEGFLKPHTVNNLATMLKVAARMAPPESKANFTRMRDFLQEYVSN